VLTQQGLSPLPLLKQQQWLGPLGKRWSSAVLRCEIIETAVVEYSTVTTKELAVAGIAVIAARNCIALEIPNSHHSIHCLGASVRTLLVRWLLQRMQSMAAFEV
jgi:hypothetical protein